VEAGATARSGGAAVRGGPLDRLPLGGGGTHGGAACGQADGRPPGTRITGEVEAALLGLLGEANHLTLAECRDRLAERTGVRVHPWTVGRALRRRGWT